MDKDFGKTEEGDDSEPLRDEVVADLNKGDAASFFEVALKVLARCVDFDDGRKINLPVIPANFVPVVSSDVDDGDLEWELPEVPADKAIEPIEEPLQGSWAMFEIDISFMEERMVDLDNWRMSMPEMGVEDEASFCGEVFDWLESAPKLASVIAYDDNDPYQFMTCDVAIDFFNRQLLPVKMGLINKGIMKKYWGRHFIIQKYAGVIEKVSCLQNVWVNTNKKGRRLYLTSEELSRVGCDLHPAFKNHL